MTLRLVSLLSLILVPLASFGNSLADLTALSPDEFADRVGHAERCAERLTNKAPLRTFELIELENLHQSVDDLVGAWAAADGETYFVEHESVFYQAFSGLLEFSNGFMLPMKVRRKTTDDLNRLRLLISFRGFTAGEDELNQFLMTVTAQSSRLKEQKIFAPADLRRFEFELSILVGQDALIALKRRVASSDPATRVDTERSERIDREKGYLEKFKRVSKFTP